MWELDYEESWAPKNWCFWTVVLEKTLESSLDCKEIQPVHPKADQPWVFTGRTDADSWGRKESETTEWLNWTMTKAICIYVCMCIYKATYTYACIKIGISSVQSLSCARLFVTPWTAACKPPCLSPTPGVYPNSLSLYIYIYKHTHTHTHTHVVV